VGVVRKTSGSLILACLWPRVRWNKKPWINTWAAYKRFYVK
jgi:hypothetical protein